MDVSRQNFQARLPFILEDVANAHFVSLDLELSGIPGPQISKSRIDGSGFSGKPTLQERYTDNKRAVDRYQVLQLGLTCVLEDKEKGSYLLKPYNLFLDPIPNEKLHIERIFSYQSGAVRFLLGHTFRMEAPFMEGVPYLSREEEATARRVREEKSIFTDIDIDENDIESLSFVKMVTGDIEAWKATRGPNETYLNITTPESHDSQTSDRGMNKYQKALVYQIVRKHPELTAVNRQSFIQIIDYDEEREKQLKFKRQRWFEVDVARQIGLRWPVEAMAGGDLSGLDPTEFLGYVEGRREEVAQQVEDLRASLKHKRTVLVGHNVFMDLMYFYKCFFGTLPDKVEDFQRVIHELFPVVIDTKFLATHNRENPAMANSSLEQLDTELERLPFDRVPIIEVSENHNKYASNTAAHEAGFDSYLTAKVLIRLSTKLEAAGRYIDDDPSCPPAPITGFGPRPGAAAAYPATKSSDEGYSTPEEGVIVSTYLQPNNTSSESISGGVSLVDQHTLTENINPVKSTRKVRVPRSESKPKSFAHEGRFDLLRDLPTDMDDVEEPKVAPLMMPPFDSHFWEVYGNNLRVNGTIEGVCNLLGT